MVILALALAALTWLDVEPAHSCSRFNDAGAEAALAPLQPTARAWHAPVSASAEESPCCRPPGACVVHCAAILPPSAGPEMQATARGGYPLAALTLHAPLFASTPWRPPPASPFL